MKRIYIRKIYPYDPTLGGKYSKFEGYSLSALQQTSPEVVEDLMIKVPNGLSGIFCSTLLRGKQTAGKISSRVDVDVNSLKELDEVLFDLNKLVRKDDYQRNGSNLVRQRFIEAFIKDELSESRKSIEGRIKKLFDLMKTLPDGKYLFISHSFFMKILEAYSKNEHLFDNPKLLLKNFDPTKKTFDFGKGFEIKL